MAPRSPAESLAAFPRGTYAKYKRATRFFLHWLLRARDRGVAAATKLPLDAYDQIVQAIARDATALPPALLREFPHALHACECAITLRTRVAAFFGESADHAHAHFLERMARWLEVLQATLWAEDTVPRAGRRDFSNYYDVLALPDDYFDGEEDEEGNDTDHSTIDTGGLGSSPRAAHAESASDYQTELACMLMELEELNEAVYAAFYAVKREEKTLLEATVVSKVAIDCAASVIANFQLHHPSVKDAKDLMQLILDNTPPGHIDQLKETVTRAWQPRNEAVYQYVPGTIVIELVGLTRALVALSEKIKARPVDPLNRLDHLYEIPYDGDAAQHFGVPDWSGTSAFFQASALQLWLSIEQVGMLQLATLFPSLEEWFREPMTQLSRGGNVSIHLVFICSCWARSIAALYGENRRLGRTISAAFMHMWDLTDRLQTSGERIGDRGHTFVQRQALRITIETAKCIAPIMRANPLVAGSMMFEIQFQYLLLGGDALMISMFQAFSHIYSALRDRQLLDEIPILEETIQAYDEFLFTPSRTETAHGSFAKSFVVSNNYTGTTVTLSHGKPTSARAAHNRSVLERSQFEKVSGVAKLTCNDFSILPPSSRSAWKTLLSAVSEVAREEVVVNRLFSRDSLRVCDDIMDLCYTLCDELGRRPHYEQMIAKSAFPDRALENAIAFPLLSILDSLERPSRESLAALPTARISGEALLKAVVTDGSARSHLMFCHRAAEVIKRRFGRTSLDQRKYFTYPFTSDWISSEFGTPLPTSEKPRKQVVPQQEFEDLMGILEASTGPLRGKQLDKFKRRVIETPSVLAMVSADASTELWSLFHQSAAGPAHDSHLVEWFIQMGALVEETRHFRKESTLRDPSGSVFNSLAIHCAAKKGLGAIVGQIVAANNFRDINTPTRHTKETLLHLAVKAGDRSMWGWLMLSGADNNVQDSSGKYVWELTTDREWAAHLKVGAVQVSLGARGEGSLSVENEPVHESNPVPQTSEEATTCHEQTLDSIASPGRKNATRKKKKKSKNKMSAPAPL